MLNIFNKRQLEYLLYFILITIYVSNLVVYNLKFQHDAQLYHYPLFDIINLNLDELSTSSGIFYYFYVSVFSVIAYPFYKLQILDPRSSFYLMIKISNLVLYSLSFFYTLKISKQIFKKDKLDYFLPILLIFTFSSFHRSFMMVKPENLIILCVLISFYLLNKLLKKNNFNKKNFIILFFILFIIGTAKLNGFYYVICFFTFLLIVYKKNIKIFKLSIYVFSFIFFYYFLHDKILNVSIYDRPYNVDEARELGDIGLFNLDKNLSMFLNFSIYESWNSPFKYSHSDSMINTLTLDLYGDYYGYGIFNHLIAPDGTWTKEFINTLINLNRTSLLLSYIFFIFLLISSTNIIIDARIIIKENPLVLYFLGLFISGIIFLVLFTIFEYSGGKNTTYKWEYINFLTMGTGYIISYFFLKKIKNLKLKYLNILVVLLFVFLAQSQLLQFRY